MTVALVSSRWAPDGPVEVAACTAGAAVPDPAANPVLVDDCETLLEMRDVLAGLTELNWTADRLLTEWEGVELSGAPPRVSGMQLVRHGLSGVIPAASSCRIASRRGDVVIRQGPS